MIDVVDVATRERHGGKLWTREGNQVPWRWLSFDALILWPLLVLVVWASRRVLSRDTSKVFALRFVQVYFYVSRLVRHYTNE